jgi:hypothetical protein
VLAHRAVVVGREVAHVRRHAFSAMEDLHGVGGGTGFELFPGQRIGNRPCRPCPFLDSPFLSLYS